MMRLIEFKTPFVVPSDDEIREGIEIARRENCIVRIGYFIPYFGYYRLDIDPASTFEECHNRVNSGGECDVLRQKADD